MSAAVLSHALVQVQSGLGDGSLKKLDVVAYLLQTAPAVRTQGAAHINSPQLRAAGLEGVQSASLDAR